MLGFLRQPNLSGCFRFLAQRPSNVELDFTGRTSQDNGTARVARNKRSALRRIVFDSIGMDLAKEPGEGFDRGSAEYGFAFPALRELAAQRAAGRNNRMACDACKDPSGAMRLRLVAPHAPAAGTVWVNTCRAVS
jgi:hypothetical protein